MSADSASSSECTGNCPRATALEAENRELSAKVDELEEQLAIERDRATRLQKKNRQYDNAHTPSSKQRGTTTSEPSESSETETDDDDEQTTLGDQQDSQKQPGRNEGHDGTTRPAPTPDRTVVVHEECCGNCGSELDDPDRTTTRTIEDIPDPRGAEAVEYEIGHYECGCGEETVAVHEDLPDNGNFGHNVLTQTTLLKFDQRVPYGRIQSHFEGMYDLHLSTGSLYTFTGRVADQLRPFYDEIRQTIRESAVAYTDETGISLNGETGWVWSASTETEVIYALREDRSQRSIEHLLGEDYAGTIACDGWRSYGAYSSNLQRCWAHLLNESEFVATKYDEAAEIDAELHEIYDGLKRFLDRDPPPSERDRERRREQATQSMQELVDREPEHEEVDKLLTYIENGMGHWLTFVTKDGVEPTNNRAERALRKIVTLRKISGAVRSERGQYIMETVMTAIETWKARGLDPHEELLKALKQS